MIYVAVVRQDGNVITARVVPNDAKFDEIRDQSESRNDWKTLEAAQEVAEALNAMAQKQLYIATDAGPHVSPRYDVIELPKVGDKVSYAFNGDSYPCGKITSISKTLKKITTSEGRSFYRVRQTGCWKSDGTWSLVPGHVYKQNPSF